MCGVQWGTVGEWVGGAGTATVSAVALLQTARLGRATRAEQKAAIGRGLVFASAPYRPGADVHEVRLVNAGSVAFRDVVVEEGHGPVPSRAVQVIDVGVLAPMDIVDLGLWNNSDLIEGRGPRRVVATDTQGARWAVALNAEAIADDEVPRRGWFRRRGSKTG